MISQPAPSPTSEITVIKNKYLGYFDGYKRKIPFNINEGYMFRVETNEPANDYVLNYQWKRYKTKQWDCSSDELLTKSRYEAGDKLCIHKCVYCFKNFYCEYEQDSRCEFVFRKTDCCRQRQWREYPWALEEEDGTTNCYTTDERSAQIFHINPDLDDSGFHCKGHENWYYKNCHQCHYCVKLFPCVRDPIHNECQCGYARCNRWYCPDCTKGGSKTYNPCIDVTRQHFQKACYDFSKSFSDDWLDQLH